MIFETAASPGAPQELECAPAKPADVDLSMTPWDGMFPGIEKKVSAL